MNKNLIHGRNIQDTYKEINSRETKETHRQKVSNNILKRAIEKELPLHKDKELLEDLAKLDIMKGSPEEYYSAVSEIISYINKIDRSQQEGGNA